MLISVAMTVSQVRLSDQIFLDGELFFILIFIRKIFIADTNNDSDDNDNDP